MFNGEDDIKAVLMIIVLTLVVGMGLGGFIANQMNSNYLPQEEACEIEELVIQEVPQEGKCYFLEYDTKDLWYGQFLSEKRLIDKMNALARTNKTIHGTFKIEFVECEHD
tara:strand:- start:422 stop:751 length:330 start_codon:yes stop_codon:yes gene_type:complete